MAFFGGSFSDFLTGTWEESRGYLKEELEQLRVALNAQWSQAFNTDNSFNANNIQGDPTIVPQYIANTGLTPEGDPALKWDKVDVNLGVKSKLKFSNFVAATAPSTLVGRESGSAGDFEQISLGAGLVMTGTVLDTTGASPTSTTAVPSGYALALYGEGSDDSFGMIVPGTPGTPGAAGATGATGPQGPIGFAIDGIDGEDAYPIPGPAGINGTNGTNGAVGPMGPPGLSLDNDDGDGTQIFALPTTYTYRTIGITIDGGGAVITGGVKGFIYVPFACTIIQAVLLSTDASATAGSCVIDIWKDIFANYPPDISDTITAGAYPTLSTSNSYNDTTLTGWTKSIAAGDVIGFQVRSASTVTRVTMQLTVQVSR